MNWYKFAYSVENFTERSDLNSRIREFKDLTGKLSYFAKYVYQNARHTKDCLKQVADNKKIKGLPKIYKLVSMAYEKALDNYDATSEIIKECVDLLFIEIKDMEKTVKEFIKSKGKKNEKE